MMTLSLLRGHFEPSPAMPHRIIQSLDLMSDFALAAIAIITKLIIFADIPPDAAAATIEEISINRWFLVPIVGALAASVCCKLLAQMQGEDVSITAGRVLAANCFAIMGCWITGYFCPFVRNHANEVPVIGTVSFGVATVVFFASKQFADWLNRRSGKIAITLAERKLGMKPEKQQDE